MDQKLLDALNNLSFALEEISESLKERKGAKSDTTTALQSGNFSKTINQINVGIKSIKKDTEKILKQQKTILELSKKKQSDKKTDAFESDPKKESSIKKGVTSILLIAAGVLAIGLAFKLVGKVDFLSVIALGIGIYSVAVAFEKIGRLKDLSWRKVFMISSIMPLMGMGIYLASKFMGRITPMSVGQIIAAIGIATAFYFMAPVITSMMDAMMNSKEITLPNGKKIKSSKFDMGRLKATMVALPILMVAMAMGIMLSSRVLAGVKPMGLGQIITSIAIAGMFALAASGVKGLIHALTEENEVKGKGGFKTKSMDMSKLAKIIPFLPLVMLAIAVGITLSSYVLSAIKPIGLGQAITAILIAGMFAVVSWGISKMITALSQIKDPAQMKKMAMYIPLILPAIALAIAASSWVLSLTKPITFGQFLTGLAISIMFIAFSVTLLILAKADLFGKIQKKDLVMIPLMFAALSLAIMLSSWILSVSAVITFGRSLEILAFSVVLCIAVIVVALTALLVTKIGDVKMYAKAGVSIAILAATIMFASLLIDKGKYNKYPGWRWSLFVGLSLVIFGGVSWALMKIGSVSTYIKGAVAILVVAATIMATSHILGIGKYTKYPTIKWTLSVALALALFGVGAVLLGTQVMNPLFYGGLGAMLLVAATVVAASHLLGLGNYKKYPTVAWGKGVGLALAAFGVGASLLGFQVLNPFFYGGLGVMLLVAGTVVAASHILNKGNYKKYPTVAWGKGVGLALAGFAVGATLLGFQVLNPFFGSGLKKIKQVAQNIVDTSFILSKGNWKSYPDTKWAKGVSAIFKEMSPVFSIISKYDGILSSFDDIMSGMMQVGTGMVTLSFLFKDSNRWKYPPIKWAGGVASNVIKFVDISNYVNNKLDFLAGGKVTEIVAQMAITAAIIKKHEKDFRFSIPESFIKNLSGNLKGYVKLDKEIEALQSKDKGVLRSAFDFVKTQVLGAIGKVPESSVNKVLKQLIVTASLISSNRKSFDSRIPLDYVKNLGVNLKGYAILSKELEKIMTIEEKKSISLGIFGSINYTSTRMVDLSSVNRVAQQMVITAKIMSTGAKYMNQNINPNYMKNLSSNLLWYARLSRELRKEQTMSNFVKNMAFGDPISNAASGMVKLAKAYDRLSISIRRLGGAMKLLDANKLKQFRGLTANVAVLSALDSKMFDNMLQVLESRSSVFAKILKDESGVMDKMGGTSKRPQVGAGASKRENASKEKRGKHGDLNRQMDILIELMANIVGNVGDGSTLDNVLKRALASKSSSGGPNSGSKKKK